MLEQFKALQKIEWFLSAVLLAILLCLPGCQIRNHSLPAAKSTDTLKQTYYPIEFTSFDGTRLTATVFQPQLAANQSAPVIIQLHAFAISRVTHPKSIIGNWLFSGESALALWQRGYWVISLDLRGHGDSEGMINLADPEKEIRDIQALLDWITNNLPRISQKQQDPIVGIIGDSYGAGIALLTSAQDQRIDAVVSANGWYDLKEALEPNQIPKIGWLMTPLFTGHFFNPGRMNSFFDDFYQDALDNRIHHQYDEALEQRSLRYWCEAGQPPQADVLILQGTRDILFDFNQGIDIQNCLKKAEKQSRLLGIYDGHLQPFLQWGGSNTFYHVDNKLHCGNHQVLDTQATVENWFDYILKDDKSAGKKVPDLCISTSANTGVQVAQMPVGGKKFQLREPLDSHRYRSHFTPKPLVSYMGKWRSGPTQPMIFELQKINEPTRLVGTPQLQIKNLQATTKKMNLFIGIGILEKNKLTVIDDQVVAIKSDALNSLQKITLKTLAIDLTAGQTLVCVIYAYQHRQGLDGHWWQDMALVGEVALPLTDIN